MTTPEYLRRPIEPRQMYRRWIDARVYQLRLREVLAYLLDRGWKELPPDRPGYRAFQEPTGTTVDGMPVCQFLPASEADDLPVRMFELLTGLAEYEDRPAAQVIDDILIAAGQSPKANGVASANTGAASLP